MARLLPSLTIRHALMQIPGQMLQVRLDPFLVEQYHAPKNLFGQCLPLQFEWILVNKAQKFREKLLHLLLLTHGPGVGGHDIHSTVFALNDGNSRDGTPPSVAVAHQGEFVDEASKHLE